MKNYVIAVSLMILAMVSGCRQTEEEPIDTKAPTLTLMGAQYIITNLNEDFVDPGYSAMDDTDGNLTDAVSTTTDLDVDQIGDYSIQYHVEDAAGNSNEAVRDIEVVNSAAYLAGFYSVSSDCSGSFWNVDDYTSEVTYSETTNNEIHISHIFVDYNSSLGDITAHVEGDSVFVSAQQVDGVLFSGSGPILGDDFIINGSTSEWTCEQFFDR